MTQPKREDYTSAEEFYRAFHAWRRWAAEQQNQPQ